MTRPILICGVLAAGFGVALIIPAIHQYLSRGFFSGLATMVVLLGILLIAGGGATGLFAFRRYRSDAMPAPVRATVMATIVFLSFCALEISDGLLYGLVSGHRWAWWAARITAALAILWFVAFIVLIPFADLRTD